MTVSIERRETLSASAGELEVGHLLNFLQGFPNEARVRITHVPADRPGVDADGIRIEVTSGRE